MSRFPWQAVAHVGKNPEKSLIGKGVLAIWLDVIKKALGLGRPSRTLAEERKAIRIPCDVLVRLQLPGGHVAKGAVVDIGTTGMKVQVDLPLPLEEQLEVLLMGQARGQDIRGHGHRRVVPASAGRGRL